MKMQMNNSHRAFIAIAFLVMLFITIACTEKNEPDQQITVSSVKHGSTKAPFGGSSPLISASLYGFGVYRMFHFFEFSVK